MTDEHTPEVEFSVADLRAPERVSNSADGPIHQRFFSRPSRRVVAMLAAIVILCAGGLGAFAYAATQRAAYNRAHPVGLNPLRDGVNLLFDAQWAPDGGAIAMLGASMGSTTTSLGSANSFPVALIYDYPAQRLVARVTPQSAILAAIRARYRVGALADLAASTNGIYPDYLIWSPDGQRLYLQFVAYAFTQPTPTETTEGPVFVGLAELTRQGALTRIMVAPIRQDSIAARWDLVQGTVTLWQDFQQGGEPPTPFAPATAYQWGANDTITPLTPPAGSLATGQPVGGQSFTIWQPGEVTPLFLYDPYRTVGGLYITDVHAIAPDDAALVTIQIEVPLDTILVPTNSCQCPALDVPPHDAALAQIPFGAYDAVVAWSPDGRYEASMTLQFGNHTPALRQPYLLLTQVAPVTLARVTPLKVTAAPSLLTGGVALRWSPDGTRVLALDLNAGVAEVVSAGR